MPDLEPTVEMTPDPLAALREAVTAIRDKIERDQFHAELVAKLQDEIEAYRRGAADRLLLPLITEVVRLRTDVSRMLDAVRREPTEKATPERLANVVAEFCSDLDLLLDHGGVTLFVEAGDTFNPHRQVAQRTDPAPEPALVGKIAERLRQGFEYAGRVIEKERVAVYVAPQAPTAGRPARPLED
jgi:molecular chaperone GrpE (heat shock protein)